MLKPLTPRQQTLIINNIVKACSDITKLNKQGYVYLYLCSGFVANYSLHGFIDYHLKVDLRQTILAHANANKWANFTLKDADYDYYMTKAKVYAMILNNIQ